MKIRLYKDSDWELITDAVEPFTPLLPDDSFLHIAERSVAVTGTEANEVMACGGITFLNNTEGLVWVKVSKGCRKSAYKWARTIRETFRVMLESVGDLKVYTYVLDSFCKGDKLARMIGLTKTDETATHNGKIYYKYTAVT
jgi:hypothetical protein